MGVRYLIFPPGESKIKFCKICHNRSKKRCPLTNEDQICSTSFVGNSGKAVLCKKAFNVRQG